MIDFSQSEENAKMLIARFLETGEQPNFMEYLCFKGCYVDGEFYGYGAEYVIENFQIYVGISQIKVAEVGSGSGYSKLNQVSHCYCPCEGQDFIREAKRQGVDFTMKNGRLHLIRVEQNNSEQRDPLEVEYDKYSYYSRRASKATN